MRRKTPDSSGLAASLVIGTSLLFVLFLIFSWGNSLLRDAVVERQLEEFNGENERVSKENKRLRQEHKYLSSPQYRNKWAKQHKGLAQEGERVIIVEFQSGELISEEEDEKIMEREFLLSRPNREQWRLLFFPMPK